MPVKAQCREICDPVRMSPTTLLPEGAAQALTLTEAVQHASSGIVSRTLLQTPEIRVVLFTFATGQELSAHASARRAIVQILDGSCEFLFGGQWSRLSAGALLHLPPYHSHAVRATEGPFTMLLTLGVETAAPSPPKPA